MEDSDNVILSVQKQSMLEITNLLMQVAEHLTSAMKHKEGDYQIVTNKALLLLFKAHLKVVEQIEA